MNPLVGYVKEARAQGKDDATIRKELQEKGEYKLIDIENALAPAPLPHKPLSTPPVVSSAPPKKSHVLAPFLFFVAVSGFFGWAGYETRALENGAFLVGSALIVCALTLVFIFTAWVMRVIGRRWGEAWRVVGWLIIIIALGVSGTIWFNSILTQIGYTPTDLSLSPGSDWKSYQNKKFGLSLMYPPTMEIGETSDSWGFSDLYSVHLEPLSPVASSSPVVGITIYSTPDMGKCDDLMATTYMPKELYKHKKTIGGKEFTVAIGGPVLLGGRMYFNLFGYKQTSRFCKVATIYIGGYVLKNFNDTPQEIDNVPGLQLVETILSTLDE